MKLITFRMFLKIAIPYAKEPKGKVWGQEDLAEVVLKERVPGRPLATSVDIWGCHRWRAMMSQLGRWDITDR